MAMTRAWASAGARDNTQVDRVVRCAQRDRDTPCSSGAPTASRRSPSLKAPGARYGAEVQPHAKQRPRDPALWPLPPKKEYV